MINFCEYRRDVSTCTCHITCEPVCTSTPNSSGRIVDCCMSPDVSNIEIANTSSQSPVLLYDTTDIDDAVILQCSESCSSQSVESPPNITSSIRKYVLDQLNRTYEWTCGKTPENANKTCTLPFSETCPTLKIGGDRKRLHKSCEFRPRTKECCEPVKTCAGKHVDFVSKSCATCTHAADVENKFCEQCRCVLESTLSPSGGFCKHVDVAERLCDRCKHLSNPPRGTSTMLDQLYETCRGLVSSVSCQFNKPCKHIAIEDKLCKHCKQIVDSAPCPTVKSCKHIEVLDKLCKYCKYIVKSAPPLRADPCVHAIVEDKLCKHCKNIVDTASNQTGKSCKHVVVFDQLCDPCKQIIKCVPEQPRKPCRHVDQSRNLTVDSASCCCDNSTKHTEELSKSGSCGQEVMPRHGSYVIEPSRSSCRCAKPSKCVDKACDCASFQSLKTVVSVDKACNPCFIQSPSLRKLKPCKHADNACDPAPFQSVKIYKHVDKLSSPCSTKLLSVTQPIESCNFIDKACGPIPCKCVDKACGPIPCKCVDKACGPNTCKYVDKASGPVSCKCVDKACACIPCKYVDKACDPVKTYKHEGTTCKVHFNKEPFACQTIEPFEFVDKACGSAPSQSVTTWKHAERSHIPCFIKVLPPRHNYQPQKFQDKACAPNPRIYVDKACDPAPFQSIKTFKHVDKSFVPSFSKELSPSQPVIESCEYVDKACEPTPCKYIDKACDPAPFQSIKTGQHVDKTFHPLFIKEPSPCQSFDPCKCADKACDPIPCKCADKACDPIPCKYTYKAGERAPFQSIRARKCADKGCDPCIDESAPCDPVEYKNVRVQVPEKGDCCKCFEELFFNHHAQGPEGRSYADLWKCGKCSCALESQSAAILKSVCPLKTERASKSTSFDAVKESVCQSSGQDSPGSESCATARARYYQNKLLATLQILQNKEETVQVQAESLAVAESRIAALTTRHTDLRREIDRKEREIQSLRKTLKENRHCKCKVEKFDASMTAEEMDDEENIVKTLQNNLGLIEDLYRECFYETVKQENLIEMLRQSNLDIRLMDKEKSERIFKLNNVINTQKWSLDRCQDIATEVENLKMEISNFINSSSNDSGMWEESVVSGINEDLQDIAAQLLRLKDLLTGDCTCGLEEENMRLKQHKEMMKDEITELRSQICCLETSIRKNNSCKDKQYQEQIDMKERELCCVREQLHAVRQTEKEKTACVDMLTKQIDQTKAALDEKTTELCCMQKQCRIYEETIKVMKEELNKTEHITNENAALREELRSVSRRAARLQRRAADLEAELGRARAHCEAIEEAYREKMGNALELERALDRAHARGAELCAEAGRVVRAVRCWAHRMKDAHREQEKVIKQKECSLRCLQVELEKRKSELCPRGWEERESPRASCSAPAAGASGASCSKCVRLAPEQSAGSSEEREQSAGPSEATDPAPACSTPLPACSPKRTCLKKKSSPVTSYCGIRRRYGWLGPFSAVQRDAGAQLPTRCDASTRPCGPCGACPACLRPRRHHPPPPRCPTSPGEEMFSRMESLSAALADGYKRWSRRAT